jgi:chromosome segregation ATPase
VGGRGAGRARLCDAVRGRQYVAGMANAGERIRTLEMRVERLETWAGPGQNEVLSVNLRALRADVVVLRRVQNQHTVLLEELSEDVSRLKADVAVLKDDVTGLKSDVTELKDAVAELRADVTGLKTDVTGLKDDVAGLRRVQSQHTIVLGTLAQDVTELKSSVQEILRRLPPAPAA